ncbi:MAG: hypothetical protein JST31_14505 [Actinobacteria bacterium]|nr:hypothetical protein [Actinomycetota bacterium]
MATAMREAWTDERLDDLKQGMHSEFARVDRRFEEVDRRFDRVDAKFDRVDRDIRQLRSEMNARFERVDERFDSLNRTLILGLVSLIAAILARGLL